MSEKRWAKRVFWFAILVALLIAYLPPAFAEGFVTVNVASGGVQPKVFIVTKDAQGNQVRTPVPAGTGKIPIPADARLEVADADKQATLQVERTMEI